MDHEYRFSATQNDGRITQRTDCISGEAINYQYDSLKRLISAQTTGPQWGQSFGYDGFGNLLSQTVTKGSAPSLERDRGPGHQPDHERGHILRRQRQPDGDAGADDDLRRGQPDDCGHAQ